MKKAQARKTVTISDVSYTRTTVVDALPEAEATWYTHAEMTQKQLETSRKVLRLSRLLMSAAPESFTTDQQLQCLGIERRIVPAIAIQARQERRNHQGLIIRAQHVHTDKGLSILSNTSSASACQRAYLFANRHFNLAS
jgi:hypothetical protein